MAKELDLQIECYRRLRWLTKSLKLFLSFAFYFTHECCSTTGKPTRSFATERVSLDSV